MTLNCKVGDLAIVVRSQAGNEGKIVRCVRLIGKEWLLSTIGVIDEFWMWEIDRELPDWEGNLQNTFEDAYLRPIRPLDEPETTTTDDEVMA